MLKIKCVVKLLINKKKVEEKFGAKEKENCGANQKQIKIKRKSPKERPKPEAKNPTQLSAPQLQST